MKELVFQKKVISYLKELNAYVINIEGLKVGLPDLILSYKGKFVGIELKGDSGYKIKPNQTLQLKKIRESGGISFSLRYSKNWKKELIEFLEEKKEYLIEEMEWDE